MPTKHIQDKTWDRVQEQYVKAVVATKSGFKETEILNLLIDIGIKHVTEEDYMKLALAKQAK
nr:MAG TPA: hypothetical protein [Inoviridae sp.]